jgi:outer membrane protein
MIQKNITEAAFKQLETLRSAIHWRVLSGMLCCAVLFSNVHVANAQSAVTLTLEEAIAVGQKNSRALKISAAKVDAAKAKASEMNTTLLPSVKLTAGYQRLSDVDPFQITVPFSPKPIEVAPTVLNNYTARLALQQPLFTGFKLESNSRAADLLEQASVFDNANDNADLSLSITTAYWALYQVIENKKFVDENVARLQSNESDVKNLLKAGMATRNDLLKIQLQLNNAKLTQIDAANDMQLAMMNLNNVMGQDLDVTLLLSSKPRIPLEPEGKPLKLGETPGHENLFHKAVDSRADLRAMESRVEAAKATVSAVQGNWFPQVFLSGGYTYARPNQRYQPTKDEFKGTWDIGVNLSFDVFNWGATAHQADQAKAQHEQTAMAYQQLKENILLDLKRYSLAVERAKEKVQVAMLAIEQADENQRSTNDKFKQGLATSTELLDANVSLLQAKTNYSSALVEHEVARARLSKAVGVVE